MNIQKSIILSFAGIFLLSCTPRVDDVFEDTSVTRLEMRRTEVIEMLTSKPNGWVMEYFAQSDPTSSSVEKHRGYTFLMQFRNDGTVTVGALVNGVFNTETSMWDVINDNSTVLTFNTFNSIFHYYSNPDPELGLWGADGVGIGGDYEFLVLTYNKTEDYQLLKGKKWSCYIHLTPLADNQDWEEYFGQLDKMKQFLFEENLPLGLYAQGKHFSLFNGPTGEFRAFEFGADTLGGGEYHGFIITEKGIRIQDQKIVECAIGEGTFNLNEAKDRLVAADNSSIYIEMEGATAFESSIAHGAKWQADTLSLSDSILAGVATLNNYLHTGVGSARGNKNAHITGIGFSAGNDSIVNLNVIYTTNGKNSLTDVYYFDKQYVADGKYRLSYRNAYGQHNLLNYNGADFVNLFNGTYTFSIIEPFHPSKGLKMTQEERADFSITLKQ